MSHALRSVWELPEAVHLDVKFAVLALFVVFAVAFAAEPAKDLKGAEQFYAAYPYAAYGGYAAYPYAHYAAYSAYPYGFYYR
ncbi:hypothetical protein C0J52_19435 [Blattella germanica]|nr:hypothetical protein C0J52_19435 [Blattella germanica]